MADCANCTNAKDIENLKETLNKHIEKKDKDDKKRDEKITKLETDQKVSEEKFKNIMLKLDEIITTLKQNSERPKAYLWAVAGSVTSGVIVGVIVWAITK